MWVSGDGERLVDWAERPVEDILFFLLCEERDEREEADAGAVLADERGAGAGEDDNELPSRPSVRSRPVLLQLREGAEEAD